MSARRKTRTSREQTAPAAQHLPPRIHSIPVTGDNSLVPDESVAEAESELGQNEWVDPETGDLAEGEAPPRLGEE